MNNICYFTIHTLNTTIILKPAKLTLCTLYQACRTIDFILLIMDNKKLTLLQMDTLPSNNKHKEDYGAILTLYQKEEKIIKDLEKIFEAIKECPEDNTSNTFQQFDILHMTLDSLIKQEIEIRDRLEANDDEFLN